MQKKSQKIVIIGGSVAGLSAAVRIRRIDENAEILVIEKGTKLCFELPALPYFASGLIKKSETFVFGLEEKLTDIYRIEILKGHKAISIKNEKKRVSVKNLATGSVEDISYDRVIVATGFSFQPSKEFKLNANNLFTLDSLDSALKIREYIAKSSAMSVLIVGANYYALQAAGCFLQAGYDVSVLSRSEALLDCFDSEFSAKIKDELQSSGVKLYLNSVVKEVTLNESGMISRVETFGSKINTQLVIYADELKLNNKIISNLSLKIGEGSGIIVNDRMESSEDSILAAGAISETYSKLSGQYENNFHFGGAQLLGRIAGSNAVESEMSYKGNQAACFFKFNKMSLGLTGMTEKTAAQCGKEFDVLNYFSGNKERFVSSSRQIYSKLIIEKGTRRILGAQVISDGDGVSKQIDTYATAIYSGLTVEDLTGLTLSYYPDISPYRSPINGAGMVCENRYANLSESKELEHILKDEDSFILDIRSEKGYSKKHINNSICIPLEQLRDRLEDLPTDKNIYIVSNIGLRGYVAERILKGCGFTGVYNIDGGISSLEINENIF